MNDNKMNRDKQELAEKVRELSFVKAELELYLDTHPRCKTALDYYYKTVDALKALREEYANTVGPITAGESTNTEQWAWIDSPWPWYIGNEVGISDCNRRR